MARNYLNYLITAPTKPPLRNWLASFWPIQWASRSRIKVDSESRNQTRRLTRRNGKKEQVVSLVWTARLAIYFLCLGAVGANERANMSAEFELEFNLEFDLELEFEFELTTRSNATTTAAEATRTITGNCSHIYSIHMWQQQPYTRVKSI